MKLIKGTISGFLVSLGFSGMLYAGQGVSDTEIIVGSRSVLNAKAFTTSALSFSVRVFEFKTLIDSLFDIIHLSAF